MSKTAQFKTLPMSIFLHGKTYFLLLESVGSKKHALKYFTALQNLKRKVFLKQGLFCSGVYTLEKNNDHGKLSKDYYIYNC